jgi:hypothetical protein
MHKVLVAGIALLIALGSLRGCRKDSDPGATADAGGSSGPFAARPSMPAGTSFDVRITSGITSETAHVGDAWTGVVVNPVTVGSRVVVPAGSSVQGVVTGAQEARRGSRAMLDLTVQQVDMEGGRQGVNAVTDPVIAGSPRARNLGAIAGGAAASASWIRASVSCANDSRLPQSKGRVSSTIRLKT